MTKSNELNRNANALISLIMILLLQIQNSLPAFGQTKPVQNVQNKESTNNSGNSQIPSASGSETQNTVPHPYEDAAKNMVSISKAVPVNQRNIDDGVQKILTGQYAPNVFEAGQSSLVLQAAGQRQGVEIQHSANNILSASLSSVNEFSRGMTQFYKDSIVGNLFQNIGQLNGKWLSELTGGWISDAAQYLAQFLRVFVLNPNVAVNGLGNNPTDGISPYVREGADIMYGIAVDLMLLLFILCIWKFWADASWGGAGNLMAPVGRLIFTSGLLLAWPTIYAFEIQISNEMIKAVYANNPEQIMQLDFALAQVVKGGVVAAGAGAVSVFAPVLSKLALPVVGELTGSMFYFASTLIFTILGGIIIAELIYVLILKAIQTALLTAQYMFAPIFLVFFATPDTESYATGYIKAFVETSLWTFVWVGLLKIMTIILFSNFNPWGKALISIGVLQLMIQVPSFIGRAQISPASDFISAGLVFGTFNKALGGLRDMSTSLVGAGMNWFSNDRLASSGLQQSTTAGMQGLATSAKNPELLNNLNKASEIERTRQINKAGPHADSLANGPQLKTSTEGSAGTKATPQETPDLQNLLGLQKTATIPRVHPDKVDSANNLEIARNGRTRLRTSTPPRLNSAITGSAQNIAGYGTATGSGTVSGYRATTGYNTHGAAKISSQMGSDKGPSAPISGQARTATGKVLDDLKCSTSSSTPSGNSANSEQDHVIETGDGAMNKKIDDTVRGNTNNGKAVDSSLIDRFKWGSSSAHDWNEANLIHVDTRKLLSNLTAAGGVGLRVGQPASSALGSVSKGIYRVNIAEGAGGVEMTHAIYSAAFANNIATDEPARDAARQAAIRSNSHQPTGFMENMCANLLGNSGGSWNKTSISKQRFQQSMFEQAIKGSQDYISQRPGNAYTEYLRARYGQWGDAQDAEAIHLINNPESSESPWNRNIGPATDALIASGIPIDKDTRAAMQNPTIQSMHPARRKQAIFTALSYTYPRAKALYGEEDTPVFKLAHGEMAKALPGDELNNALALYQFSGQDEINSPMAPQFISVTNSTASVTQTDFATAYSQLASQAPRSAQRLGYIHPNYELSAINSFSDLALLIEPRNGESSSAAMQIILDSAHMDIINRAVPEIQ